MPAIEAYYLGTSVEEVLGVATGKGGFHLDDRASFVVALEEVLAMSAEEIRACGLGLRDAYAARKVAARMLEAFEKVVKV